MTTYDRIKELCDKHGIGTTILEKKLGFSQGYIGKLRKGCPSAARLQKIAAYFNVTTDYLMGDSSENEETPTPGLSAADERDIARDLERLKADLESADSLMFDGNPMSDEARESILAAMKLGLEAAKIKNKETYTPKKYRKE